MHIFSRVLVNVSHDGHIGRHLHDIVNVDDVDIGLIVQVLTLVVLRANVRSPLVPSPSAVLLLIRLFDCIDNQDIGSGIFLVEACAHVNHLGPIVAHAIAMTSRYLGIDEIITRADIPKDGLCVEEEGIVRLVNADSEARRMCCNVDEHMACLACDSKGGTDL